MIDLREEWAFKAAGAKHVVYQSKERVGFHHATV
jgi:hypothetical protein